MNCAVCSAEFAESDLIAIEGRQVCGGCKPLVLQQLREGVLILMADLSGMLRAERELGFGELLAATWTAFAKDWVTILVLTLLVALPINFILAAVDPGDEPTFSELGRYLRHAQGLETVFGVFAVLGIAYVVSERLHGRAVTLGGALLHAARRYLAGLGTGLLSSLIIGLLLLALVVPGIIWYNYYAFVACVVSLRNCSGLRALGRSKAIVKGRWWNVAWKLAGLVCIILIPAVLVSVAFVFAPESSALSFISDVLIDLFSSFGTVGTVVLFLHLEAVDRNANGITVDPPTN